MLRRTLIAILCVGALAAGGCGDGGGGEEEPPAPPQPDVADPSEPPRERPGPPTVGRLDFGAVETIAEGLAVPWGLAFIDRDTILVTERPGRVRVIEDGRLRADPVAELDVNPEGEAGLLGIALHPDFPEPRTAFLYYTAGDENRISRFQVARDLQFERERILLTAPASSIHDGGHIAFGPDGLLYAGTGDASQPGLAADPGTLAGKVLRLQPGGAPAGARAFEPSPVLSFGHRNPQGFDWDGDGRLYASEHGPSGEFDLCCHDEINLVRPGEFYGWPYLAGGVRAQGGEPPASPVPPIAESGGDDAWAPAGLAVHQPSGEPTELLVAQLAGERLVRIELEPGAPRRVATIETVIDDLGRLRAAVIGPDGCLYITTSNTDGRGSPRDGDDRVARVCQEGG